MKTKNQEQVPAKNRRAVDVSRYDLGRVVQEGIKDRRVCIKLIMSEGDGITERLVVGIHSSCRVP